MDWLASFYEGRYDVEKIYRVYVRFREIPGDDY